MCVNKSSRLTHVGNPPFPEMAPIVLNCSSRSPRPERRRTPRQNALAASTDAGSCQAIFQTLHRLAERSFLACAMRSVQRVHDSGRSHEWGLSDDRQTVWVQNAGRDRLLVKIQPDIANGRIADRPPETEIEVNLRRKRATKNPCATHSGNPCFPLPVRQFQPRSLDFSGRTAHTAGNAPKPTIPRRPHGPECPTGIAGTQVHAVRDQVEAYGFKPISTFVVSLPDPVDADTIKTQTHESLR